MPTKIEWTDETWNPIRARNLDTGRAGHFCVHVSPACEHCYAEVMQARLFGNPVRYAAQDAEKVEIFMHENALMQPLRWRRPRRIFVCSMTDLFYEGHSDELIDRVFAAMALAPQHTFQVLTKRAERMRDYIQAEPWDRINAEAGTLEHWDKMPTLDVPPRHIWLGVSAEDQRRAEERIPVLLDTPAAVRFLSAEPLLGPIDLTRLELVPDSLDEDGELRRAGIRVDALRNKHCESGVKRGLGPLDQVIVGGESGHGARPMHPQWARDLRDQCEAAGTAFFFKQWGEWLPGEDDFSRTGPPHYGMPDAIWQDGQRGHRFDFKAKVGSMVAWARDGSAHHLVTTHDQQEAFRKAHGRPAALALKIGKKRAGRLLDGREWNEVPA